MARAQPDRPCLGVSSRQGGGAENAIDVLATAADQATANKPSKPKQSGGVLRRVMMVMVCRRGGLPGRVNQDSTNDSLLMGGIMVDVDAACGGARHNHGLSRQGSRRSRACHGPHG